MPVRSKINSLILVAACTLLATGSAHAAEKHFTIYEFIPYQAHAAGGTAMRVPPLNMYLESLGIHRIDVVYENRFMTNGDPDEKKIEAVAKAAHDAPAVPVSFDTEFGDRFKPDTVVPKVSEILRIYHKYNSVTPAGVYATVPQNTYAWKPDITRFDSLSEAYAPIAQQVDFLSPVLYNYAGADLENWKRAAVYNMAAAQKYKTGKRIIPYLNPTIRVQASGADDDKQNQHGPVRMLTEAEMLARLQELYDLGADGCIVWASSGDRTVDGNVPVFDRDHGWGKALVDFAKAHK